MPFGDFLKQFESNNPGRDNLSRETGRRPPLGARPDEAGGKGRRVGLLTALPGSVGLHTTAPEHCGTDRVRKDIRFKSRRGVAAGPGAMLLLLRYVVLLHYRALFHAHACPSPGHPTAATHCRPQTA